MLGRPAHRSLARAARAARAGRARGAARGARAGGRRGDRRRRAGASWRSRPGAADGDAGGARDARSPRARARPGAVLLGPNCLGVFDAGARARARPQRPPARPDRADLPERQPRARARRCWRRGAGLGFSRFVSVGNQADLETAELVARARRARRDRADRRLRRGLPRRARVRRRGAAAARRASRWCCWRSSAPRRRRARVRSHTGALASDGAAIDAACRAAGDRAGATPAGADRPRRRAAARRAAAAGRRVAVLADGGGHGGIAAALLERRRARAAARSATRLRPSCAAGCPPTAAVRNPIDLAGGGEQDIRTLRPHGARAAALGRGRRACC